MIQDGKLRGFAMGHAIPVRTDYTAGEVRRFAQRAKDAAQARRLLAIAAVLDGASREEAAKIGGMDRQTLRGWVIRYEGMVSVGGNLYSVPDATRKRVVEVHTLANEVRIFEDGALIAAHPVLEGRHQRRVAPGHRKAVTSHRIR